MFDINRERTTQRFGLSGINFNEIVGRIRSLDGLYTSTIQKVEFWSGKEFTFAAKIAAGKWSVYRLSEKVLGSSFFLEYVLLWLFTSIELSMYMEKKSAGIFQAIRFLSLSIP